MEISKDVMQELTALIAARREAEVVDHLLREAPDDGVLLARQETVQKVVHEAVTVLRAALAARGYSMEQLQAELRTS